MAGRARIYGWFMAADGRCRCDWGGDCDVFWGKRARVLGNARGVLNLTSDASCEEMAPPLLSRAPGSRWRAQRACTRESSASALASAAHSAGDKRRMRPRTPTRNTDTRGATRLPRPVVGDAHGAESCYNPGMSSRNAVLAEALQLPPEERADVAKSLIASLDGPADEDVEAAWLAEVERRLQGVDRGTAKVEPWDAVRDRLASRLRTNRK